MTLLEVAIAGAVVLVAALLLLALLLRRARQQNAALHAALQTLDSAKRSQSTKYGQLQEQFAPFLSAWPWDSQRFRFLGSPIDGVQFTDDGVVFVEIKTHRSRLSAGQRQVRDHVLAGRVTWHEFRLDDPNP